MTTKHVTYTIPIQLDKALHQKIGRGKMSSFVTEALWSALKREEHSLLMEFLEADKDSGNREVKRDFASLEGENFFGLGEYEES